MPYRTGVPSLATDLPPVVRLAIGYASLRSRDLFTALFLLDRECAGIVARRREPLIAQIRLAWWRERLGEGTIPEGHRLRPAGRAWEGSLPDLIPMIDGWEELLSQAPDLLASAQGRSVPFGLLARKLGGEAAVAEQARICAQRWALVDLAGHLSIPSECETALDHARALPVPRVPLPRSLRPLTILDGLALRTLRRGSVQLLGDRLSPLAALRLGIFGR